MALYANHQDSRHVITIFSQMRTHELSHFNCQCIDTPKLWRLWRWFYSASTRKVAIIVLSPSAHEGLYRKAIQGSEWMLKEWSLVETFTKKRLQTQWNYHHPLYRLNFSGKWIWTQSVSSWEISHLIAAFEPKWRASVVQVLYPNADKRRLMAHFKFIASV